MEDNKEDIEYFELDEEKIKPTQVLKKRKQEVVEKDKNENGENGKDGDEGPQKLVKVKYQDLILENLPTADFYERSLMHKEIVNHVISLSKYDLIITMSIDGHIKFWRKAFLLVEFAKHFRAHKGVISSYSLNQTQDVLCTVSPVDKTLKKFDILNTDMLNMVKLNFPPGACQFVSFQEQNTSLIAISDTSNGNINIIDDESETKDKIIKVIKFHASPVKFINMNFNYGFAISIDQKGGIDVWDPLTWDFPKNKQGIMYSCKMETDFYDLLKCKTHALAAKLSNDGKLFAVYGQDRIIRIFNFLNGKIFLRIDETAKLNGEIQDDPNHPWHPILKLDRLDFDRRMAIEKDIEKSSEYISNPTIEFDETGTILIYPSVFGIKFFNLKKNDLIRVSGKQENTERIIRIALFQGQALRDPTNQGGTQKRLSDPSLFCCAFKKNRYYIFTKREPEDNSEKMQLTRDIFNERPSKEEQQMVQQISQPKKQENQGANIIIQTSMGDIFVRLFSGECPRTVENFLTHAKNNYYQGLIFHRVIKGFMIQTGCPKGDGTGGESIWGGEFEDEFHHNLRHDQPFTLSMANAGPNTNGSQFFITVCQTSWLDKVHTVFGRVTQGSEVVQQVNRVQVDKNDKPLCDVKIQMIRIL